MNGISQILWWQDAKLVIEGHDPQLEKAVEVALELLKNTEVKLIPQLRIL
jgi:hypothetical protein